MNKRRDQWENASEPSIPKANEPNTTSSSSQRRWWASSAWACSSARSAASSSSLKMEVVTTQPQGSYVVTKAVLRPRGWPGAAPERGQSYSTKPPPAWAVARSFSSAWRCTGGICSGKRPSIATSLGLSKERPWASSSPMVPVAPKRKARKRCMASCFCSSSHSNR